MKKVELAFSFLLVPVDYLMVILAAFLAYFLRFKSFLTEVRPVIYSLPFDQYIRVVALIAFGWLVIFAISGLYRIKGATGSRRFLREFSRILLACSTAILAIIVFIFFGKEELFSSRFIVLAFWILSIITVTLGRITIRSLQRFLFTLGYGVHNVVLIGQDKNTEMIESELKKKPSLGFRIVERLKNFDREAENFLNSLKREKKIDEIIQIDPNLSKEKVLELVDWCNEYHVAFKYAPDLFQAKATNVDIGTLAGIPIIELKKTPLDGWGKILKRIFDFIGSLFLLIISSPIILIIAIAIKLDSRGPIIYKNERVSIDGPFTTYKFRSMKLEYCTGKDYGGDQAEKYEQELIKEKNRRNGPLYKVLKDPRRTAVGRFLERTSLDELPQLFNVLIGNMSLVGPRPHQPREVEKYEKHHKEVLAIKPGITGLAQISGRSDLDFDEEVKLDTYYIENWSLLMDIWILLKTPWTVITRRSGV